MDAPASRSSLPRIPSRAPYCLNPSGCQRAVESLEGSPSRSARVGLEQAGRRTEHADGKVHGKFAAWGEVRWSLQVPRCGHH